MQVLENILVVRLRQIFVSEPSYRDNIDWGEINQPIDEETFLKLYHKVLDYLDKKDELYVFKGYAGSDKDTMLKLTVINELAWHNLFAKNMFIRPESKKKLQRLNLTSLSFLHHILKQIQKLMVLNLKPLSLFHLNTKSF